MASLWLKLISISLIYLNVIAKSTRHQESEFECVSIDKQSALQHPLMKNHRIQTRPSRELLSILSTSNGNILREIDLKGSEECPKGQVPIHKQKTNLTNSLIHPQQIHRADLTPKLLSRSLTTGAYEFIFRRSSKTNYVLDDQHPKGCYNALCPGGYVQIHKSIYPGLVYDKVNALGGKQNTVHLSVAEDPVTKNWVLTIGSIMIGYWPRQSHMVDGASEVFFGGFAGNTASSQPTTSPPMGTGEFPTKDLSRSCFMKQLKYVLSDYSVVDINANEVEEYVDSRKCYGVMFLKYVDYDSRETLTFGGPGGQC
ncbi:unnamed protein product [Arabidopsis thaliana]|uniref:(thale cress) hypothetical protein n=1 Tax=Arabidopsis thaliana TaxID=3702 RepID=A0A7G2FKR9_ARATH|nr:unnamed protein product [Arabidopsis thaliana]